MPVIPFKPMKRTKVSRRAFELFGLSNTSLHICMVTLVMFSLTMRLLAILNTTQPSDKLGRWRMAIQELISRSCIVLGTTALMQDTLLRTS